MPDDVKARRGYDSSSRKAAAGQTRAAVLRAARDAFLGSGYVGATVPLIARKAGVSAETVYKAFGNKAGLVKAVFDVAVVGDDEAVPMLQRDFVRRNMAEPDPRARLTAFGEQVAAVGARTHSILLVVREAAAGDAAAASVWESVQQERLFGMTVFATHLDEGGHLRAGITIDRARDILWTYSSVELWDLLVRQRGWSPGEYGAWVGEQLIAALLAIA